MTPVMGCLPLPIHFITIEQQVVTEKTMNKLSIALMAVYFLGDPGLHYLAWLGGMKVYIISAAIALVSMPWVTSQLDG
jgi:hypothetical protein